jgi:hypothetical protein
MLAPPRIGFRAERTVLIRREAVLYALFYAFGNLLIQNILAQHPAKSADRGLTRLTFPTPE